MADGYISQIKLPNNKDYLIKATKIGDSDVGSATQPIFLDDGVPTSCTYTLGASVPSNAVFTDHYAWGDITSKPTTISGYGITDAVTSVNWNSSSKKITSIINSTTTDVVGFTGSGDINLIASANNLTIDGSALQIEIIRMTS